MYPQSYLECLSLQDLKNMNIAHVESFGELGRVVVFVIVFLVDFCIAFIISFQIM